MSLKSVLKRSFNPSCQACGLQKVCFPTGLHDGDIDRLEQIVNHKPKLEKGDYVYHVGMPFKSLYAIRSGVVKVFAILENGEEIVHGFYLPGDVIGFDGIAEGRYSMNAMAISKVSLCEIPFFQLNALFAQVPNLVTHLFEVMSRKINDGFYQSHLLATNSAEHRLAGFLWHLVVRFRKRGYDYLEFEFPVLHREVANYLGLTPETVSRLLTKFHQDGVLTWKKKHISIHCLEALEEKAGAVVVHEEIVKEFLQKES